MSILERLNSRKFPEDLLPIVYSFININTRYSLTKKEYEKYYIYSAVYLNKSNNFDYYIKDTIKTDNKLRFDILLKKNFEKWIKIKKFRGKIGVNHCKTTNYISYLKELTIHYNSGRCKVSIIDYLKIKRPKKNKEFKNTKIKYTRWNF
jgi:hypothetical protein|tara:strand:+ start:399 stop:845 length:447 start_codon:yes stop_codon:yes gene_type:complete